jgi:GMP synthase (glutamine-hydrolysing)
MAMKKYAVICCDSAVDDALQQKMISVFGRDGERWEAIQPTQDDFLQRVFDYSGFLVTGSRKSVIDDAEAPLVKNLLAFVRAAAQRGDVPVVGLCFGSQAIAAALGGRVEKNPSGRFKLGVDRLQWSDAARTLFGPQIDSSPTMLVQSHGECIASLPPGSVHLASSETIPNEVFLVNGQFLGIQGHPEVDQQFLRHKFMAYHRALFDDEQWQQVQQEAEQPLNPDRVIALSRHLLDAGRLPSAHSALPA